MRISKRDMTEWADTKTAEGQLPELIRRLIVASNRLVDKKQTPNQYDMCKKLNYWGTGFGCSCPLLYQECIWILLAPRASALVAATPRHGIGARNNRSDLCTRWHS